MSPTNGHENKLELVQEALIKRFPSLKDDFDANPDILEEIFADLPLEIRRKRPPKPEFSPEQKDKVKKLYRQVSLFFEYLKPARKQWIKSNDCPKRLREASLAILKTNGDLFPDIKADYLSDLSLCEYQGEQPKRATSVEAFLK